jgi:hypothetical protein
MSLMEAWRRKFEKGTKRIIYRIRNCRRTFNLQSARSIYDELLYLHIFAVKVLQFKEVVRQPATMKAVDDGWRLEVATRKTRAPLLDAAVRLERKYVRHPKRRSAYQDGAAHIEADVRVVRRASPSARHDWRSNCSSPPHRARPECNCVLTTLRFSR